MQLNDIGWVGTNLIHLAQNKGQQSALVNMETSLWILYDARRSQARPESNFLILKRDSGTLG